MKIAQDRIEEENNKGLALHMRELDYVFEKLDRAINVERVIRSLADFQVAVPSWALGTGGTRFGRFSIGGEPRNLEEKIADVAIVNDLTQSANGISLHIPWDQPEDSQAILQVAAEQGLHFDAVNSNTFQDQPGQEFSYKFGSLSHPNDKVRAQAIEHNREVIEIGKALGSSSITIWLADGTSFPGQSNFRNALHNTQQSLQEIYDGLPDDWKMYIEYKPFEPNFYSMVVPDWGTSLLLAEGCGEKAYSLVDLGHHLPHTNIEQIVATLMMQNKLGGFHFNDSKYGDDDLTTGSIKPFQLFLIFNELVEGMLKNSSEDLAWMIDASHNLKDPLEDLMQSIEAIQVAYAQALLVDRERLGTAQKENDTVQCQEILQDAFRTDVRPLVREGRIRSKGALHPINMYRKLDIRKQLIKQRGTSTLASGL